MEYYQLKYFAVVSQTLSFQLAANRLFVSRQAISKAIHQLEKELGYSLFLRHNSTLVLMPRAEAFALRAQEIVTQMESLESDMKQQSQTPPFSIRLCYADTIYSLLEEPLLSFSAGLENCSLEIWGGTEKECQECVVEGKADLSITTTQIPDASCIVVASYPIGFLMGKDHPLAQKETLMPEDFRGETFLAYTSGTDELLYLPEHIHLIPGCTFIKSDDLIYLFRRVKENRGILMSVAENMEGLIDGVVHKSYPLAGTWNHYLALSPKVEGNPRYRKVYRELGDFLCQSSNERLRHSKS